MKQKRKQRGSPQGEASGRLVLAALQKCWLQNGAEGRVILAVSGGVDSMTLLEGMHRLLRGEEKAERGRVLVVHVNHSLRGTESDLDERLVLDRARELGFEARSFRLDWPAGSPGQDACRRRRDEIFRSLAAAASDRVWLAHHLNDQAETVFFRLLRGTGARGLRGMLPVSGIKVRPFLGLEKGALERAAVDWGVPWREDSSNLDPEAYDRNWLREFFPLLEERRPGFQQKLAALAAEARSWRFAEEPGLDCFAAGEGVRFARFRAAPGTGALSEAFALSRFHAFELASLLRKSSGRLDVSGARFTWSSGVLLEEERGARFAPVLVARAGELRSPLGRWQLPPGFGALCEAGGERRKKEFQALRVPGFFRGAIPLVSHSGRAVALHPARLGRLPEGIQFTPSPLAAWWLKENKNQAQRISTER